MFGNVSVNNNNNNENQNSKFFENIARKYSIDTSSTGSPSAESKEPNNQIAEKTIENITSEIFTKFFGDLFVNAEKTESDIQIDLNKYEKNETIQTPSKTIATDNDVWIFGYGSLMWKADFPFVEKQPGFIKNFERRFYQNSLDHRGTPSKPGRVVTLIPTKNRNSKVWGMGYRVSSNVKDDVLKHLDYREKNGYERFNVKFYPYNLSNKNMENPNTNEKIDDDENSIDIIVYVATQDNDSYVGHINNLNKIVEQIYTARGPSGTNREYVYKLANSMRYIFPNACDNHLFEIESKLRRKEELEIQLSQLVQNEINKKLHEILLKRKPLNEIEMLIDNLKVTVEDKLLKTNSSTTMNGIDLIEMEVN